MLKIVEFVRKIPFKPVTPNDCVALLCFQPKVRIVSYDKVSSTRVRTKPEHSAYVSAHLACYLLLLQTPGSSQEKMDCTPIVRKIQVSENGVTRFSGWRLLCPVLVPKPQPVSWELKVWTWEGHVSMQQMPSVECIPKGWDRVMAETKRRCVVVACLLLLLLLARCKGRGM